MPNIRYEEDIPDIVFHEVPPQPPVWRNFIFVTYSYIYTLSDFNEGFEWWFPKADGDGRHHVVHHATVHIDKVPVGQAFMALFLQSEHHENRVLVEIGENKKGYHKTPNFCVPHNARSVLVLNGLQQGTKIDVSYMVERI
jgi:hypothetical protein